MEQVGDRNVSPPEAVLEVRKMIVGLGQLLLSLVVD